MKNKLTTIKFPWFLLLKTLKIPSNYNYVQNFSMKPLAWSSWFDHMIMSFCKIVEIECFVFQAAILDECQNFL